jgi:endo-1,4-beta-xylanase
MSTGLTTRRRLLCGALAALPARALADAGPAAPPSLGSDAAAHGLVYGAAVQSDLLATDKQYAALVAAQCRILMPAWEAKFAVLQPQEGKFEFRPLNAVLAWGLAQGKAARGHALIWHQQLPKWALTALSESPARARAVMAAHFDTVLAHTATSIRTWDVVNEVVADPPGSDTPQASGELRDSPWLRALGPGYIDLALQLARARDPTMRIAINEYGVEEEAPHCLVKRRRLLDLIRRLRKANVPLDAVGIQGHLQMVRPFNPASFTRYCRELRAEGVELAVTEMDVREHWRIPSDLVARDRLVADRVKAFIDAALEGGVRTFLTWGLIDRYSWLVSDPGVSRKDGTQHRGLPFDWEGNRKQYFAAMEQAFDTVKVR